MGETLFRKSVFNVKPETLPAVPFAIGSTGVDSQRKSTKPAAGAAAGAPEGRGTLGRSAARTGSQGLCMGSMGIAFPFKPCSPLCDWFDRRRFPTQIDQTCGGTNAVCDPGPPQGKKPSAGEKALRRRNGGPGGSAPWYFAFHNSNPRIKNKNKLPSTPAQPCNAFSATYKTLQNI